MRIGISGYVGNKLTGIGRVLINILRELAIAYPEDSYILFKNYDFEDYNILKQYNNIEIVDFNVSKESSLGNIIWHQWNFQKLQREYKCDIAYIPNFSLLLWKQQPTIVTIHDLIEYNVPNKFSKLRTLYRKVADPLLAHRSDFVLTVSEASKQDIIKFMKVREEKILVTPNAADRTFFRKYDRKEVEKVINQYGLKYAKYLLFVGTIDYPGKNIKTVIEAFFNLKVQKNLEDIKLVIIGKNGFNSEVIYDIVNRSEYKDDVLFTGYLKDEDLPKFYAGAAIMLYLSLYEGFGLPVLEAMSCGTPVICSNTSCFPEVVGDLDVLVPPMDVKAVENKIMQIMEDDVYRAELAENCYKRSSKYSWGYSAELYHDVFKRMKW